MGVSTTATHRVVADPSILISADDLFDLPADGMRRELVEGRVRVMPPTGYEHGKVTAKLTAPLVRQVEENDLGVVCGAETGFLIQRNPDTVRAPDISFVSSERDEQLGNTKKFFPEAPDLAVEVLSPGDTVYEVDEKVEQWLTSGVRLVWVVNPKRRTVTVYRSMTDVKTLGEGDELDGEDVVVGFRCPVAKIFS